MNFVSWLFCQMFKLLVEVTQVERTSLLLLFAITNTHMIQNKRRSKALNYRKHGLLIYTQLHVKISDIFLSVMVWVVSQASHSSLDLCWWVWETRFIWLYAFNNLKQKKTTNICVFVWKVVAVFGPNTLYRLGWSCHSDDIWQRRTNKFQFT